jgi:tetratricopeptide (TPR) repeat protein
MKMKLLVLVLPFLVGFDLTQSPNKAVEQGNARLKAGKAEEALTHYDQAVKTLAAEPGAHFDRGEALFALSRFEEAANEFLRATEARTPSLKEAAFYNLGNGYFKLEKYGEAVAAYRRALAIDPGDMKAKWNLELALKKKKDQEDKEKDKQNQDKQSQKDQNKQDQNKQDQSDKQDQKDQQGQKDQKDQQAQKDQPKPEQQKDQQQQAQTEKNQDKQDQPDKDKKEGEGLSQNPPPPSDQTPDMKEIEAVLDNLERNPKDLEKERARMRAIRRAPPRKNW